MPSISNQQTDFEDIFDESVDAQTYTATANPFVDVSNVTPAKIINALYDTVFYWFVIFSIFSYLLSALFYYLKHRINKKIEKFKEEDKKEIAMRPPGIVAKTLLFDGGANPEKELNNLQKFRKIEEYAKRDNPADWKNAILEADVMLGDLLRKMGADEASVGDMLKSLSGDEFPFIDEIWKAHKLRNELAHGHIHNEISKSQIQQAINTYKKAFMHFDFLR